MGELCDTLPSARSLPHLLPSYLGWEVPDQQPDGQQRACQARSGVLRLQAVSSLGFIFYVAGAWLPPLQQERLAPQTSEGHPQALPHPSKMRQLALVLRLHQAEPGSPGAPALTPPVSHWLCVMIKHHHPPAT